MKPEDINMVISTLEYMNNVNFFEELARYHVNVNLKAGLSQETVKEGVMYFTQKDGKQIPAAVGEENGQNWYKNAFVISNGHDLVEFMRDAGIIPNNGKISFIDIKNRQNLEAILEHQGKKDGALVCDRPSGKITRQRLNPYAPALEQIEVEKMLPIDFLSESGEVPFYDEFDGSSNVGTMTHTAASISRGFYHPEGKYHPVEATMIKHTIFNPLGFGVVVNFHQTGMEIFYFKYAPDHEGEFLDKNQKIVGMHQHYDLVDGKFRSSEQAQAVYFNEQGRMAYMDGRFVLEQEKHKDQNYQASAHKQPTTVEVRA